MPVEIIRKNAPEALLAFIEQAARSDAPWDALQFCFSSLHYFRPQEKEMLLAVKPLLAERPAAMYFCDDGDIFITWSGGESHLAATICSHVYKRFSVKAENQLHHGYDIRADRKTLSQICKQKITALETTKADPAAPASLSRISPEQLALFHTAALQRGQRERPEILIVEDQPFSSRLLRNVLEPDYKIMVAENAVLAWERYLAHAPDICLLDIELPDMNGHRLAKLLRAVDKEAYLIMVTANNYLEDVTQAKQNGAKGFIAKPYSKQKILEAVQKFPQERKPT